MKPRSKKGKDMLATNIGKKHGQYYPGKSTYMKKKQSKKNRRSDKKEVNE